MEDARLWLRHTGGETKMVIVVSFTERPTRSGTDLGGDDISEDERRTGGGGKEEPMLMRSIDETTKVCELGERLADLNVRDQLRTPLIGELEASLYIYRATEDRGEITEVFGTKILPSPPVNGEKPHEFHITMLDIFGEEVPAEMSPMDQITFDLHDFEEAVTQSLLHTAKYRANKRATKLMKDAGVWEECETFAQHKRQKRGRQ